MAVTHNEILTAIKHLEEKLYHENGFEGDIPEIKRHCADTTKHFEDHSRRLTVVETEVKERTVSKINKKAWGGITVGTLLVLATFIISLLQWTG